MKKAVFFTILFLSFFLFRSRMAFAVTEAEVQKAGADAVAGNVFIWFLCAVGFLKISQKIDSFMSSLGVNVGHTGSSMMAELLVAARGFTTARSAISGSGFHGGSFHAGGNTVSHSSFLSGGLSGAVGRGFTSGAVKAMTGKTNNPVSRAAFDASVKKGGDFANSVTGAVALGNISYTGSMTGEQAALALTSYLGQTGAAEIPSYSDVEIGGGRITGTETSVNYPNGTAFGMYSTDQYMAPEGNYETITTADNTTWYRQYATDAVERTPYMTGEGKIAYHESIVQRLPEMPRRKDRV